MGDAKESDNKTTLHFLDALSIWEVAHRYHGHHPDETNPKCLPLEVQDTIRNMALSNGFNFYDRDGEEILDLYFGRHLIFPYSSRITDQVRSRIFNKKLLDRIFIEQKQLADWLIKQRFVFGEAITFPRFWFSEADAEYFEEQLGKKYSYAVDTFSPDQDDNRPQQTKAALSRHSQTHTIKQNFIRFWLKGSYQRGQEDIAAVSFFESLSKDDQRKLAPTSLLANAKRTLKEALRAYLDKVDPPPPFLQDFNPQ